MPLLRKCFLCGKTIFKAHGFLVARGEGYEIKKPLCKKHALEIENEYEDEYKARWTDEEIDGY